MGGAMDLVSNPDETKVGHLFHLSHASVNLH
jgi:hypothetical protein